MFDPKRLEAFLDALEVETHYPSKAPILSRHGAYKPVGTPALEKKMDKYDIFNQDGYENVGTAEFPVLARQAYQFGFSGFMSMPAIPGSVFGAIWPTYGGIQRAMNPYMMGVDTALAAPVPTPYEKLKGTVRQLKTVTPAKLPNPAPPVPQKSPDYIGTLTGWRGWEVDNGLLVALGTDFDWQPKIAARAKCRREGETHLAPQQNCSCGYWSFKTHDLAIQAIREYANNVVVVGTVEIWGRVIECTNGYRSEFAYPKELWLLKDGLESLSWTYGVPVRKL